MTLDEAIKHAEEVAEEYKKKLKVYENINKDRAIFTEEEMECKLCAEEHRQLAEWLKDYKQLLSDAGVVRIGGKVYRAEKPVLKCVAKDGEHYFSGFYEEVKK